MVGMNSRQEARCFSKVTAQSGRTRLLADSCYPLGDGLLSQSTAFSIAVLRWENVTIRPLSIRQTLPRLKSGQLHGDFDCQCCSLSSLSIPFPVPRCALGHSAGIFSARCRFYCGFCLSSFDGFVGTVVTVRRAFRMDGAESSCKLWEF